MHWSGIYKGKFLISGFLKSQLDSLLMTLLHFDIVFVCFTLQYILTLVQ